MNRRTVFFVSDRTGITAETMGLSLISQFENIPFNQVTLPFIDTPEKAHEAKERIILAKIADGHKPIVFGTIINEDVKLILGQTGAYFLDFFGTFIPSLETELHQKSSHTVGKIHGVKDVQAYNMRMNCVNFALTYDDGAKTSGYDLADIILIGVSRCGKTPTSLYMAMQFGVQAANFPLTEEELTLAELPKVLRPHKTKLFGLTIDPERLHMIRSERRPNCEYSDPKQCKKEIKLVESLYQREQIPYLSSTNMSIEEIATKIMAAKNLERRFR
ncbi:MAG TPA: pyruvate, water dikinase regulatory protein [Gammaproteobacteria bacterium]|nr:pyruvate, water dikinase regulatory protein [Gammaproteobacteria bacterium]